MRRELGNWLLKAEIKIKQIGGFTKSLSLFISISKIVGNFIFFPLNPHRAFACMGLRGSRLDDHKISSFLASKIYQNINFDQVKKQGHESDNYLSHFIFLSKL